MPQIVIQADGPFSVWCNSCERWVAGARLNIDGTHDLDESVPVQPQWAKVPRPVSTTHTVWEDKPKEYTSEDYNRARAEIDDAALARGEELDQS